MNVYRLAAVFLAGLLIGGCAGSGPQTEGFGKGDGPPPEDIDVSLLTDAVPKVEPVTAAGNKSPYVINGQKYHLLPQAQGYVKKGLASWYGNKFHGRKTANGEVYNMYGMTAAHKTLPIPCYVRVTNLNNQRSVIVRVNDRGPFLGGRIIDLSYAAAKKLGYANHGTALVEVSVIDPIAYQRNAVEAPKIAATAVSQNPPLQNAPGLGNPGAPGAPQNIQVNSFLQVGAYRSYAAAWRVRQQVASFTTYPVAVDEISRDAANASLFRILVGPIGDVVQVESLREHLLLKASISSFVLEEAALSRR